MIAPRRWRLFALGLCLWPAALWAPWPAVAQSGPSARLDDQGHLPVEQRDYASQLPRIGPTGADEALGTFRVAAGFRLEWVAAEPLVTDPVAIDFDEFGRVYVVEMRGYSEEREGRLGRVRVLSDEDGDGRLDRAVTLVEGLAWPTAVLCYRGGAFVADAPDILYVRDGDGDGAAEERRVVLTGFSTSNVQGLLNSFRWGLDNRIHIAVSTAGGKVRRPDQPESAAVEVRGRDIAFDPRTGEFELIPGGAQHGAGFDDYGTRFLTSNSDHIQQVVFDPARVSAATEPPAMAWPPSRVSIAADGPQAEVFRISPVEPWRVVRTRLRAAGEVVGPVEGGGRPAGYFTGATGVTIIRGDAFDESMRGVAVIGDVGSNIVHRKRLTRRGMVYTAERMDEGMELIASTDVWFRPVQFANAPDGTLWVLDMYRESIEHPASLPAVIKRHLDLNSGRERGRLYRLAPQGWRLAADRARVNLAAATTGELVGMLGHVNAWHRETAQRLLVERGHEEAAGLLRKVIAEPANSLARLHAVYTLAGLGALRAEDLVLDEDPRVAGHALRLLGQLDVTREELAGQLERLGANEQGEAPNADAVFVFEYLSLLARLDRGARYFWIVTGAPVTYKDSYVGAVMVNNMHDAEQAGHVIGFLMQDGAEHRSLVLGLIRSAALQGSIGEALTGVSWTMGTGDPSFFAEAIMAARSVRPELTLPIAIDRDENPETVSVAKNINGWATLFLDVIGERSMPYRDRLEGIWLASVSKFETVLPRLADVLSVREPAAIQVAAVRTLASFNEPEVGKVLAGALMELSPAARTEAIEALLRRGDRIAALVDHAEAESVDLAALLTAEQVDRLLRLAPDTHREKARATLRRQDDADFDREAVIRAYRASLPGLAGDAAAGRALFAAHCSTCHRAEGVGVELAPNPMAFSVKGPDVLLLNILDPNREVNPQYVAHTLVTTDGRAVVGIVTADEADSVTVTPAGGVGAVVRRSEIESLTPTGRSLMPDRLDLNLPPRSMADLLAYLISLR